GLNAIWFNRIAKEDTLLVFFMMAGFCLYNRAKNLAEEAVQGQAILYGLSGAAFGLMFSSKYFPHYYGLLMLFYFLAGTDRRNNRPVPPVARKYHYAAMMLAFVTFNFALFLPETWRYLVNYIHEDLQTHHGYLVMGRLYPNDLSYTPGGPPWYFYWLYLLVKMPVPVIVSFCIGLIEIFRKRRSERGGRGYLFLRLMLFFWLIPMSFIGAKFLRYTLALLPFVYMTAAVGIASFYKLASVVVMSLRRSESLTAPSLDGPAEDGLVVRGNPGKGVSRVLIGAALVLIFVVAPSATTLQSLPFPGLYTNAIGQSRIGYFFPHDEFYALGARESIRYIAEHALPGSSVASEIPATLQYYLDKFGRNDLRSVIISHPGGEIGDPPDFFLVQPGRVYYENEASIVEIQSRYPVVQQSGYSGVVTTTVYQNSELGGKPRSPADNKLRASE
ncbi:MAG TPA: hypothetical protein VEZ90_01780, partial [Blastocatellia bacterium]|nr:hypothetical protein [Blastocatellia bacterium]